MSFASSRVARALLAVVAVAGVVTVATLTRAQTSTPPAPAVVPAPPGSDALKKTLESRLGAKIDSLTRLPVSGLYEVRVGEDIFYADPGGDYILVGNLIDLRSRENLTRKRQGELREAALPPFKWNELPLDTAVKVVKGNGKRKVAIFEDPNCGYCKKLEASIKAIDNVTIYVFLFPVLGEDSVVKSKQVWCAADRSKAWTEWMEKNVAIAGDASCANPIDRTLELGRKYKVDGTPTLFFANNKRVEGAVDQVELEKQLAASQPAS